jgi:hypothetical protein
MQVVLLVLCQYQLLHLQVHLLQAKEDLAFHQCLIEVDELLGPRTRGTRLGKGVLLDNHGLDMTGITFHTHLSKGTLKSPNPSSHAAMVPTLLASYLP